MKLSIAASLGIDQPPVPASTVRQGPGRRSNREKFLKLGRVA